MTTRYFLSERLFLVAAGLCALLTVLVGPAGTTDLATLGALWVPAAVALTNVLLLGERTARSVVAEAPAGRQHPRAR